MLRCVEIVLSMIVLHFFYAMRQSMHWQCCSDYDMRHVATVSNHIRNRNRGEMAYVSVRRPVVCPFSAAHTESRK